MLRTKIDENIVAAFEAASKNEVTTQMLQSCCFSDGYFVFPESRINDKEILERLIAEGKLELVD